MKSCFIVSPIGELGSDTRKRADQVLRYIIRPALDKAGYDSVRADEISNPGIITTQILNHLSDSELVIADLTGHNPNVYYELGIRHAVGKPIIHIIEKGDNIPFDLASFRTIVVDHRDLDSAENAKVALEKAIYALESSPNSFEGLVQAANSKREAKENQPLSIRAYLSDDDPEKAEQFAKAVTLLKEALDLVVVEDPPAEKGSWWKSWVTKTNQALSEPEMAERLRKAERAIEMQALHKVQSEVDKNQAQAVSALMSSIESVPAAAIQVGSLLIVKTTNDQGVSSIAVRTLTQNQLTLLEKDPNILKTPGNILAALSINEIAES